MLSRKKVVLMGILVALWVLCLQGCAADSLAPVPGLPAPPTAKSAPVVAKPNEVQLTAEEKAEVLQLNRDQYKKLSERNQAWSTYLEAQRDLSEQNARMAELRDRLKKVHNCPDCDLDETPTLTRPIPTTVVVTPNDHK